jgi:hypothetical protein
VWDCDPSQSQSLTADCAFNGQYVFLIDQGDPDMIFVYDVGITPVQGDTFTWDFEDGWQDWTHTNGVPFPGGWGIVDSGYTCGSYIVGVYGDSCMCISDEVPVPVDTAMSPPFDEFVGTYLHWAMNYQNFAGYDTVCVIARAHDGSSWGAWQWLAGYGSDMGLFWDSADVSGITGESLQVGWVWNDFGYSCWFCSFDEIGPVILFPAQGHDVASTAFLSPGTMIPPGNVDVIGEVRNLGGFEETYDVHSGSGSNRCHRSGYYHQCNHRCW